MGEAACRGAGMPGMRKLPAGGPGDGGQPAAALLIGAKGVPRSLGIGNARHRTRIAESLLSTTRPVFSQSRRGLPCLFCGRRRSRASICKVSGEAGLPCGNKKGI